MGHRNNSHIYLIGKKIIESETLTLTQKINLCKLLFQELRFPLNKQIQGTYEITVP